MNNDMKYIIFDDGMMEQPIMFSCYLQHGSVAMRFNWKVVSAGFVALNNDQFHAYGKSVSLGVVSRPEDSKIINRIMGLTLENA
jgi:hypothetical protein